MKTKLIAKIAGFNFKEGLLTIKVTDLGLKAVVKSLVDKVNKDYGDYIKLEMSPPYRARTTGKASQNAHIWGHIQQIAEFTGNEVDDIEDYIKQNAIKRGYPYKINKMTGQIKPCSMTEIDTVQAGYLIEELHKLASELEINLDEGE